MQVAHAPWWLGALVVVGTLAVGSYVVAALHEVVAAAVSGGGGVGTAVVAPWRRAALLLRQERTRTEAPDPITWALAPALYGGLAALAFAVVPLSTTFAVTDFRAGIVVWGAAEALAIVAIFLHGWSSNSLFPLIGAYRFVAQGLSYELLSMFVLIAVALPAESLQLTDIVASQQGMWNVVRQPLGLPLFLVVSLGVTFWGPLNLADSSDLAGGTSAEASGGQRLSWQLARCAMLFSFAAMGATAFLGGPLGPWLPGPVWLLVKTVVLLVVLLGLGHVVARIPPERFVAVGWTLLLPLSFLDLLVAGLEALP
jgi:NADH-quinone oxidoreductase subunit H